MPNVDSYFDEIDAARTRRARELSEIKLRFTAPVGPDPSNISSRAVIVLTYASWEGFYNECVDVYVRFLRDLGKRVRETDWMLLLGAFKAGFDSLRDRHHSDMARIEFVVSLQSLLDCGFDKFDDSVITARSNLDFARLSQNYSLLRFNLTPMQRFRIRLDKEVVKWRHSVAHGDPPDLSALDIGSHVDFTAGLLIVLADGFQEAMLERI
jgi:MAE_28990/MAE_18760-like HEPN